MTDMEKRLRRLSSTALGGDTIKRIADEVENQPLVMFVESVMLDYSLARKGGCGRE